MLPYINENTQKYLRLRQHAICRVLLYKVVEYQSHIFCIIRSLCIDKYSIPIEERSDSLQASVAESCERSDDGGQIVSCVHMKDLCYVSVKHYMYKLYEGT